MVLVRNYYLPEHIGTGLFLGIGNLGGVYRNVWSGVSTVQPCAKCEFTLNPLKKLKKLH